MVTNKNNKMINNDLQNTTQKTKDESVNRRRTDNTMAKIKRTKGHTTIYKTYT
jgi:hypothetical protein